jgi:hypothetical protein
MKMFSSVSGQDVRVGTLLGDGGDKGQAREGSGFRTGNGKLNLQLNLRLFRWMKS